MTFRHRLQYFLVKKLQISNKEALRYIRSGLIYLNGKIETQNVELSIEDEVVFEKEILKESKKLLYFAYHKPRGIETTMNTNIPDNLAGIIDFGADVFPIGRLDKDSEGLLLFTNDGRIYDAVLRHENGTEKEYEVIVNQLITTTFIKKMQTGVTIMGQTTLPCEVWQVDDYTFRIILKQGLNRQIRRMCYKLGYVVERLMRHRIGNIQLNDLPPADYKAIAKESIEFFLR